MVHLLAAFAYTRTFFSVRFPCLANRVQNNFVFRSVYPIIIRSVFRLPVICLTQFFEWASVLYMYICTSSPFHLLFLCQCSRIVSSSGWWHWVGYIKFYVLYILQASLMTCLMKIYILLSSFSTFVCLIDTSRFMLRIK